MLEPSPSYTFSLITLSLTSLSRAPLILNKDSPPKPNDECNVTMVSVVSAANPLFTVNRASGAVVPIPTFPLLPLTKNSVVPDTLVTLSAPSADEPLTCNVERGVGVPTPTKSVEDVKYTYGDAAVHPLPPPEPPPAPPDAMRLPPTTTSLVKDALPETLNFSVGLIVPIPTIPFVLSRNKEVPMLWLELVVLM